MITEKRLEKGISQNQLAKMCKVPQSVISDIESGKTKAPRIDTLRAIAAALGVTIDELTRETLSVPFGDTSPNGGGKTPPPPMAAPPLIGEAETPA